jgi:hypothetical protein
VTETNATHHFLTFLDGRLTLTSGGSTPRPVTRIEDLAVVGDEDVLLCSSSIDFPEEYTTDATLIAICRKLRG